MEQLAISVVVQLGRVASRGMGAKAASAAILLALAGCGQRGPLVLPAKPGVAQATAKPPAPTASSPGLTIKY